MPPIKRVAVNRNGSGSHGPIGANRRRKKNAAWNFNVNTGVLIASIAVMNLMWGLLGDKAGHKLVLTSAAFAMLIFAPISGGRPRWPAIQPCLWPPRWSR